MVILKGVVQLEFPLGEMRPDCSADGSNPGEFWPPCRGRSTRALVMSLRLLQQDPHLFIGPPVHEQELVLEESFLRFLVNDLVDLPFCSF